MNPNPQLTRAIGLPHATAMVVGTIIGASIFVQPSEIAALVPTPAGVFLVWLVSGVLTLFGALVCAELASTFSNSGGVYLYLKEAYSPALGFLWGWAMFWTMHSGILAAIAVICARYVAFFIPMDTLGMKAVAIVVILALSAVNYVGVKQGSRLQTFFTAGKLIAVVAIIVFGFALGSPVAGQSAAETPVPGEGTSIVDFALALVAGLFAFGGWHMVTYSAEETVNPRTTIPRALMFGTMIVTGSYVAVNAVYFYLLPPETVAMSTRVAADAADAILGSGGGAIMSGLVVFSTIGGLTGIILAGPHVYYAMARDGMLFRWFGDIHPRYRTPHRAILAQAVWSSVLVATGTYRELFTRVIYTEWIFFGLMALGLFMLRRRSDLQRGYSIWGYPVVPVVFALSSFAIVVNQVLSNVAESAVGLLLVLVGFPVYVLWAKKGLRKKE
ncbi:MAG TPA: amino acid permease [Bacteroidota bacterium]